MIGAEDGGEGVAAAGDVVIGEGFEVGEILEGGMVGEAVLAVDGGEGVEDGVFGIGGEFEFEAEGIDFAVGDGFEEVGAFEGFVGGGDEFAGAAAGFAALEVCGGVDGAVAEPAAEAL